VEARQADILPHRLVGEAQGNVAACCSHLVAEAFVDRQGGLKVIDPALADPLADVVEELASVEEQRGPSREVRWVQAPLDGQSTLGEP
jgi:hypothetical protein